MDGRMPPSGRGPGSPGKPANWGLWLVIAALAIAVPLLLSQFGTPAAPEISYSRFKALLAEGRISAVEIKGETARVDLTTPEQFAPGAEAARTARTQLPPFTDPELLPLIERQDVALTVVPAQSAFGGIVSWILPWVIILAVYFFLMRRLYGGMQNPLGQGSDVGKFLSGKSRESVAKVPKVTFAQVAGQDQAKREVQEVVDFLRDPERYTRLGADVPHGILLMGPPGTGKTLLAKALAGEAKVPFFSISASEFIEVFVGVGASRVRHMFDEAKKRAPAIIFIDELDSVGRVRGTGFGGGHDEREQTLNQILAELDGFEEHEAVVVLAATNRPDVLDPALLRPGRFDRHVTLELPDTAAREAILRVHIKRVPLASDVELATVAKGTPGFSGADLKNLVNEAAMMAAREGKKTVAMRHFDEMRDRIIMGTVRTLAIVPEERHRLAVHEAGHVIAAYFLPKTDPLYKVTIIPRGRALGGTHQLPEEERHTLPEDYLRDRLGVMLGGRIAESMLLGTLSSGSDDDIRQATALARAMVTRWGMDPAIGPIDLRQAEEHPFLGREIAQPRYFSEETAHEIDLSVRRMLNEAEERVRALIEERRGALERLIARLEADESLGRAEIEDCLGPRPETKPVASAAG